MFSSIGKVFARYQRLETLLHTDDNSLSTFQFLLVATCRELNPMIVAQFFHLLIIHEPGKLFVIYMFETFFISIPIYTILLFLGSYSKTKMLTLWNWIPVLKGCGFVLLITHLLTLLLNQHIASYLIQLLTYRHYDNKTHGETIFESKHIWDKCDFLEADKTCLPKSLQFSCQPSKYYEHHLMQFTRKEIFRANKLYEIFPVGPINIKILIIQVILWILNGIAILIGIKRTVKLFAVYLTASIILLFFVSINVIFMLVFMQIPRKKLNFLKDNHSLGTTTLLYWLRNIIYASGVLQTGSTIWLGSIKPDRLRPLVAALIIFSLKLLIFKCLLIMFKYAMDLFVANNADILENCQLYFDDLSKLCTIFDVVMKYKQPNLWLIFYIGGFAGITIMDNMFGSILLYESLIEENERVKKYHILTTISFISFCCAMSVIFTTRIAYTIWYIWIDYQSIILGAIIFVFITLLYNYFYTSDLTAIDYQIIYKEALPDILARAWSSMPALALILFASVINSYIYPSSNTYVLITKLACLSITILICLPPILVFSIRKSSGIPVSPEPQNIFAPQDEDLRIKRLDYKHDRDIAFRHDSACCIHTCLLKYPEFKNENIKQKLKFETAFELYSTR